MWDGEAVRNAFTTVIGDASADCNADNSSLPPRDIYVENSEVIFRFVQQSDGGVYLSKVEQPLPSAAFYVPPNNYSTSPLMCQTMPYATSQSDAYHACNYYSGWPLASLTDLLAVYFAAEWQGFAASSYHWASPASGTDCPNSVYFYDGSTGCAGTESNLQPICCTATSAPQESTPAPSGSGSGNGQSPPPATTASLNPAPAVDCLYSDCVSCASASYCGWCATSSICLSGTDQGATSPATCSSVSWIWASDACPVLDGSTPEPAPQELCPSADHPAYNLDSLPYECWSGFSNCAESLCSCVGLLFDTEIKLCAGKVQNQCSVTASCSREYVSCVNTAYVDALDGGVPAACNNTLLNFFDEQAVRNMVVLDNYNTSGLFDSCEAFVCGAAVATGCDLDPNEICEAPTGVEKPITPVPGSTPAPTMSDGSYAVPTKVVRLTTTFTADFGPLVATAAGKQQIIELMTDALTKKLRYKTIAISSSYASSSGVFTTVSLHLHVK